MNEAVNEIVFPDWAKFLSIVIPVVVTVTPVDVDGTISKLAVARPVSPRPAIISAFVIVLRTPNTESSILNVFAPFAQFVTEFKSFCENWYVSVVVLCTTFDVPIWTSNVTDTALLPATIVGTILVIFAVFPLRAPSRGLIVAAVTVAVGAPLIAEEFGVTVTDVTILSFLDSPKVTVPVCVANVARRVVPSFSCNEYW